MSLLKAIKSNGNSLKVETIRNQHFEGERPLFEKHHLLLEQVTIGDGESAIKECSDIEAVECRFWGKYPFWHVHGFRISRCQLSAKSSVGHSLAAVTPLPRGPGSSLRCTSA